MSDGGHTKRCAHAIALAGKFERNTRMIEKTVWQDEKDFTFDLVTYKMTGYMEKKKI